MVQLVESIKILNGRCYNLSLHEARANRSRKELFHLDTPIHLKYFIDIPEAFQHGLVKCRIVYDTNVRQVTYHEYAVRNIHALKLIFSDHINYHHKFVERSELDHLFSQKGDCDEIIIVKHGWVTDAYYYNLVFEKNGRFYTPLHPLLPGVQRQKLLNIGHISAIAIHHDNIQEYDQVHLINALTTLHQITLKTNQIRM